ncbi:MAG TPA: tetratricopeptide repeat protein, partial [Arenimonas sp.]|nr:tetratricopeptide repeat protein [Arenimonas sp.]
SLRRTEGRVRITAQLIDASNGFHVWSQPYDRDDSDLFALQDEIADAIAKELSTRIAGVAAEAPGDAGTANAEALQAYLQGRQSWRQRTPASLDRAELLFRRAVELDPDFARAWSGLADTYLLQADYGNRPMDEAIALAEPAVVQAVNLQPQLGEAWASLGLLRMNVGQTAAAQRSLEDAMRLDPRYEMAPMWLASVYARAGQPERQREVLLRALELNPLEPVINVNLAGLLAGSGRIDEARAQLQRVLAIVPQEAALLRSLADIEQTQGNFGAALRAAEAALATDPTAPANIETLLKLLAQIEAFDQAEALARQLPAGHRNRALALQEIEIRRGGTRVLPELAERIANIPEHPRTPVDRQALTLGGMAQLRAGNPAQAAEWLRRAAGSPQQLDSDVELLESASLLLAALQQLRQDEEAARWQQALDAAARGWLRRVGDGKGGQVARMLLALQNNDLATADAVLQEAFDTGFRARWVLLYDPRFAALRERPLTQQLLQRMDAEFTAARSQLGDRAG